MKKVLYNVRMESEEEKEKLRRSVRVLSAYAGESAGKIIIKALAKELERQDLKI